MTHAPPNFQKPFAMLFLPPYFLGMTEIEQRVLDSLLEMERAVQGMAAAKTKPDLLPIFARLDRLARQLPPSTDPMLVHYLHRKSYQKARLLLQELAAR
ncbi:MAG: hypothetical protein ABSA47_02035 [Verrucomicrobiota bacterium]|jgi:hypothetical protein